MKKRKCGISQAAVLKQMVLNTSNSLELFREAVSNSIDADCREINIALECAGGDVWDVVIQDDGHGMEEAHMCAFFNMGESVKDFESRGAGSDLKQSLSIGEKGLGSKTAFVAKEIRLESCRKGTGKRLVSRMSGAMDALRRGELPAFELEEPAADDRFDLQRHGTRIELSGVRIPAFNGKACNDAKEVADRLMHYLRTSCATGTVKNLFAGRKHIKDFVLNVASVPDLTIEVNISGQRPVRLERMSGAYEIPDANVNPTTGQQDRATGVRRNSEEFCDTHTFSRDRTISVRGENITVYYDGLAIIAGASVRGRMLKDELKQGWTHKSQMGLHLCRDFIPLRVDGVLSRDLLDPEYYYEFKVFLNCQWFTLNADRNCVTNQESDEVAWIFRDFRETVWPQIEQKYRALKSMREAEEREVASIEKTQQSAKLKSDYVRLDSLVPMRTGAKIQFAKLPQTEADVSHLLAMVVQSEQYQDELQPIARFGSYIDKATDLLCEDAAGKPLLVEVERTLPSLFRHGHPVASYDVVVVWELGGMSDGDTQTAYWGDNGTPVSVKLIGGPSSWKLSWGTRSKRLIVLSDFV
jgi:hypothetical protein